MRLFALIAIAFWPLVSLTAPSAVRAQTVEACSIDPAPANCAGKYAVIVTEDVPHGAYVDVTDPGCLNDAKGAIAKVLEAAIVGTQPELYRFSGPISTLVAGPVDEALRGMGGTLGGLVSPYSRDGAYCGPLVALVPLEADVTGYRFAATDAAGGWDFGASRECTGTQECPIGWSRFQAEPVVADNDKARVVSAVFMNWSHDRQRRARMILFYRMAPGARPPIPRA